MGRVVGLVIEPEELIEESPEGDGPKSPNGEKTKQAEGDGPKPPKVKG